MHNNTTNLLPLGRKRKLSRDFKLRIGVVVVILTTILTFTAAILLIPTYVFLEAGASAKTTRLAGMEATLSSNDETTLLARITALSSNATKLTALSKAPSASSIIRAVLAISRPGITLSGFSYTPSAGKIPTTVVISGSSTTRDALRNYQLTLQGTSFISSATLPVSAYANDTNITFSITLTLTP